MTLETIKAGTAGIADTISTQNPKLFQEVLKLVQNMPGGASGLLKQFQDKGLGNVASSLTAKGPTQTITSEQIVLGLGADKIDALATASGFDRNTVRGELVTMLPKVVQQLTAEKVVAAAAVTA